MVFGTHPRNPRNPRNPRMWCHEVRFRCLLPRAPVGQDDGSLSKLPQIKPMVPPILNPPHWGWQIRARMKGNVLRSDIEPLSARGKGDLWEGGLISGGRGKKSTRALNTLQNIVIVSIPAQNCCEKQQKIVYNAHRIVNNSKSGSAGEPKLAGGPDIKPGPRQEGKLGPG